MEGWDGDRSRKSTPPRPRHDHAVDTDADGDFAAVRGVRGSALHDSDFTAANTQEDPDRVRPVEQEATVEDGELRSVLPPASWSMFLVEV